MPHFILFLPEINIGFNADSIDNAPTYFAFKPRFKENKHDSGYSPTDLCWKNHLVKASKPFRSHFLNVFSFLQDLGFVHFKQYF